MLILLWYGLDYELDWNRTYFMYATDGCGHFGASMTQRRAKWRQRWREGRRGVQYGGQRWQGWHVSRSKREPSASKRATIRGLLLMVLSHFYSCPYFVHYDPRFPRMTQPFRHSKATSSFMTLCQLGSANDTPQQNLSLGKEKTEQNIYSTHLAERSDMVLLSVSVCLSQTPWRQRMKCFCSMETLWFRTFGYAELWLWKCCWSQTVPKKLKPVSEWLQAAADSAVEKSYHNIRRGKCNMTMHTHWLSYCFSFIA